MKTNGLRNKKPAMARAAWRVHLPRQPFNDCAINAIWRWHRAAKGMKWA